MKSAAPYIKEAVVLALNKDDFSAVSDLTSLLQALLGPPTNGHRIPKTLVPPTRSDTEPKYTPRKLDDVKNTVEKKTLNILNQRAGRFKYNDKVHSCYEIKEFFLEHVIPTLDHGVIYSSADLYKVADTLAASLSWYLEGDTVEVKAGGPNYVISRFRSLLNRVFIDLVNSRHFERAKRPPNMYSNSNYYQVISPLAQNAPQSSN